MNILCTFHSYPYHGYGTLRLNNYSLRIKFLDYSKFIIVEQLFSYQTVTILRDAKFPIIERIEKYKHKTNNNNNRIRRKMDKPPENIYVI